MSGFIKLRGGVCGTLLAIACGLGAPAAALAVPPSGRVAIENRSSGQCLTPAGGVMDLNAETVQYICDGHPSRFWSFTLIGGDVVAITNLHGGVCLTVAGGRTEANVASVQYTCDAHPSRRWRYVELGGGLIQLVNVNSGLCLTVAGGSSDRNAVAVQYPCDGHPSRDWRIRR